MATAPASAQFELLVSRNSIREKIRAALKLYVGHGCRYTAKEIHQATGVEAADIHNAMRPAHDPSFRALKLEELASVAKFLRAPFASIFLEVSGLGAFDLMDGQQPLPDVLEACAAPAKLTREEHIAKAREHLNMAEGME